MLLKDLFLNNKNLLNAERMLLHFNDVDALSVKKKKWGGDSVSTLRS